MRFILLTLLTFGRNTRKVVQGYLNTTCLALTCFLVESGSARATVVPLPGIPSQPTSTTYTMTAAGQSVQVKAERFGFDVGMFTTDGSVAMTVTVSSSFSTYSLLPARHNIAVTRNGNTLSFTMPSALKLVLKVDALAPLAILATPLETNVPNPGDPYVIYFAAGTTTAGVITPLSNQTVYLAPGALVLGRISAVNVSNVTVKGRGFLETAGYSVRANKTPGILFENCSNITVEGIGVRSYDTWWQSSYLNSQNISVSNINEFGLKVNTDGVDIDGVKDFTLTDSFIRSEDDGLGWHAIDAQANGETITERATANNVVIWNTSFGNGMRMPGAAMEDQMWRDITISNVDILHHAGYGIFSDHSDWAWVENMTFQNVTILKNTTPVSMKIAKTKYSNNNGFLDERGHFDRLIFNNVKMRGGTITLNGFDSTHKIDYVYFNSCVNNGTPITSLNNISVNAFVTNVLFNQSVPPPFAATAGIYEAEYTDTFTNVKPQITYSDANMSNGKGKMLKASAINDYVTYLPSITTSGTYAVQFKVKKGPGSGKFQLSLNGSNISLPQDLYSSNTEYALLDFGSVTFTAAGTQPLKCTVTGKNTSSTGYQLDFDYLAIISTPGLPPAPTNLTAASGRTQVTLAWNAAPGATSYNVKIATLNGGPYTTIATGVIEDGYVSSGLVNGTTYYYVVSAVNSVGEGPNSGQASATPQEAPVITIKDNADSSGVAITGSWTASTSNSGYYGINYIHDQNTGRAGGKSVTFTPTIPKTGTYAVYLNWPAAANRATNTPVDVFNGTTTTTYSVNQQLNGTWVLLGTAQLNAGTTGYVKVRNDGANGYVIADAVKFVLQ